MWPLSRGGLGSWDRSIRARALDLIPWLPTIIGVVTLLALMVVAAVKLRPWQPAPPPLPGPAAPLRVLGPIDRPSETPGGPGTRSPGPDTGEPGAPGAPGTGTPGSRPTTVTVAPVTAPTTGRPQPRPRTPAPTGAPAGPPSPVTGRYRVMNSYRDSFQGEVLVSNGSASPQDWTVTLVFPGTVGALRTSWLESLPQPTLAHSGETYTWRSSVPLAPGSSGALRFEFARTGTGDTPLRCVTNGNAC